jgi:hypothetical protein
MTEQRYELSDTRVQEIAERAAAKALQETFRLLGFDMTDVNNLRDDFRFVRRERSQSESRRSEVFKSATTAVIGAVVGVLLSACTLLITALKHQL